MSSTLVPEWFATHGWLRGELEFLAFEEDEQAPMVLVLVGAVERASYVEIDQITVAVWRAVLATFPTWRGQRMTLGEVWFFAPDAEGAQAALGTMTRMRDVRVTALRAPAGARARLRTINTLGTAVLRNEACAEVEELWRLVDGAPCSP